MLTQSKKTSKLSIYMKKAEVNPRLYIIRYFFYLSMPHIRL